LARLHQERSALGLASGPRTAPSYREASTPSHDALFQIRHTPIRNAPLGQDLKIEVRVTAARGPKWVRLRYRAVNQTLDYETLPMEAATGSDFFSTTVPAEAIDPKFDFMYFFEVMDREGYGLMYPNFERETPYFIVNLDRN
jgi:hypothetical protein